MRNSEKKIDFHQDLRKLETYITYITPHNLIEIRVYTFHNNSVDNY